MTDTNYNVVIIGGGPGGYVAAIKASKLGLKVALIEKRQALGGTCLNIGCIPSKALLESSELYHKIGHEAEVHGITSESPKMNIEAMMKRKETVVTELTDGIAFLMKKNKVDVYNGSGKLIDNNHVEVSNDNETQTLSTENIILATGSVSVEIPSLPFDGTHIVSSTEALSFPKVPEHLLVVGAGAIGLELGSVWKRLGAKVTIVELLPNIAPFADKQSSSTLMRALKEQGIEFKLKSLVKSATINGNSIDVIVADKKEVEETISCDKVLVAVGRKPFTEGLGLDALGITIENNSKITSDEQFRTNVDNVYAIGDITDGPMLAHKAEEDGVMVAEIIAGKSMAKDYTIMPSVVYTEPELASVGLTEVEAKEQKLAYNTGRFLFNANGRAKAMNAGIGQIKILVEKETDKILGAHIVGPKASELIAELVLAMHKDITATELGETIHGHPTLSEAIKEAALAANKNAIHA